ADPSHATALARLAERPSGPTPIGVFRDVERAVYGADRQRELEAKHAAATLGDVGELLRSRGTWAGRGRRHPSRPARHVLPPERGSTFRAARAEGQAAPGCPYTKQMLALCHESRNYA